MFVMTKYYVSNGKGTLPFGWVLKEIEDSGDKITVLDEIENQVLTVPKLGLVEISKEDYEKINELNRIYAQVHMLESYEIGYEINRILKKYGVEPY